jgi:plastocyanin
MNFRGLVVSGLVATVAAVGTVTAGTAHAQLGGTPQQQIVLKSLQFKPNKVNITTKTKLSFVWKEAVAHNIVFENKGPKSATLNKGTWEPDMKLLAKPGTYKYKCTLHPGMNGQITVK